MFELNQTINWKPKSTGKVVLATGLPMPTIGVSARVLGHSLPIWHRRWKEELCIGSVQELKHEMQKAVNAGIMTQALFEDFILVILAMPII